MRLADVPRLLGLYYGWPAVFVATLGFVRMIGHRADRSITRPTLAVWLVVCGSFLVIGIVTPVDMRHYLAALPLLAVFVGIGVGEAISRVKGSRAKGRGQRAKGT
jgi:hypothetical protein